MEQEIIHAVEVLQSGGIILYPTDTIWGIGCDARNAEAVERLYAIKERDRSKSMLVLVRNCRLSRRHTTEFGIRNYGERPTTYILPHEVWYDKMGLEIASNLPAEDGTLGVRCPRHHFCQEVLRRLGAPLVSTSANFSGRPSPQTYDEIGEDLKRRVDYCVAPLAEFLSGETRGSRIVKVNPDGSQTVLRP